MAIGAALAYAGALCAVWSSADRFEDSEQDGLRFTGAFATTALLASVIWRVVPETYVGLAWLALAVVLLELGMRKLPVELRRLSYILAVAGIGQCVGTDQIHLGLPLVQQVLRAGVFVLVEEDRFRCLQQALDRAEGVVHTTCLIA